VYFSPIKTEEKNLGGDSSQSEVVQEVRDSKGTGSSSFDNVEGGKEKLFREHFFLSTKVRLQGAITRVQG